MKDVASRSLLQADIDFLMLADFLKSRVTQRSDAKSRCACLGSLRGLATASDASSGSGEMTANDLLSKAKDFVETGRMMH